MFPLLASKRQQEREEDVKRLNRFLMQGEMVDPSPQRASTQQHAVVPSSTEAQSPNSTQNNPSSSQQLPSGNQPRPPPRKTVVLAHDNILECPECHEQIGSDEVEFKSHVFKCRAERGTNPMLPLHIMRRRPLVTKVSSFRPRTQQSTGGRMTKEDLLDNLLRPLQGQLERVELFGGHCSSRSSTRSYIDDSPRNSAAWGQSLTNFASFKQCSHVPPPHVARSTSSTRGKKMIFVAPPTPSSAPHTSRSRPHVATRSTNTQQHSSQYYQDSCLAVRQSIRSYIQFAQACHQGDETEEQRREAATLHLQGLFIDSEQLAILQHVIGKSSTLNIRILNIRNTRFDETAKCDSLFIQYLLENKAIEEILADGSTIQHRLAGPLKSRPTTKQSVRNVSPQRSGSPTSETSVLHHIEANRARHVRQMKEEEFESMVRIFEEEQQEKQFRQREFYDSLREDRLAVRAEERDIRHQMCEEFVFEFNRLLEKKFREEMRAIKRQQREELYWEEDDERVAIEEEYYMFEVHSVLKEEDTLRKLITNRNELEFVGLRLRWRDTSKPKELERQRLLNDRHDRANLESECQEERESIAEEEAAAHAVLAKQVTRCNQYMRWRLQQQSDLKSREHLFITSLENIMKDEVKTRADLEAKLARWIEATEQKNTAQVEALVIAEAQRREIQEGACSTWYNLSLKLFHTEGKLIRLMIKSKERETVRIALLHELPMLKLGGTQVPLIFVKSPLQQAPMMPVPFFPNSKLEIALPSAWMDEMTDAEQKCKVSVADERTAMGEHFKWLEKHAADVASKSDIILADFEPFDLSQILAITKKEQLNRPTDAQDKEETESVASPKKLNKSTKRPETPPGAPLDIHFVKARDRILGTLRAAWADKHSVGHIKKQKEQVVSGVLEVTVVEPQASPTDADSIAAGEDAILVDTIFPTMFDDVDVIGERNAAREKKKREEDDEEGDGRDSTEPGACEDITSSTPVDRDEGDDEESEEEEQLPAPIAKERLIVNLTAPKSSASPAESKEEGGVIESENAEAIDLLTHEKIADCLQRIMYQNTKIISEGSSKDPAFRLIHFGIHLQFHVQDAYYTELMVPDRFNWAALPPALHHRDETVSIECNICIAVTPPLFLVKEPFPDEIVRVEGQMKDLPLLLDIDELREPVSLESQSKTIATSEEPSRHATQVFDDSNVKDLWKIVKGEPGGWTNGTMEVAFWDGNAGPDDRICLQDDLPSIRYDLHPKTTFVNKVYVFGEHVGTIAEGNLQSAKHVTPTNGLKLAEGEEPKPPLFVMQIKNDDQKEVSSEAILQVVRRLKYNNFAEGPEVGERRVRITLTTQDKRLSASIEAVYDVQGIDKPTELRIAHPKMNFRAVSEKVPSLLRSFVRPGILPVAQHCVVFDEDTDRFSGGFLELKIEEPCKGDALVFVTDTNLINPIHEAAEKQNPLSVDEDGVSIIFEGRVVAMIKKCFVYSEENSNLQIDVDNPPLSVELEFAQEDDCSILAVQTLLHHICLVNIAPFNLKTHLNNTRNVEFLIQIMDSEQACQMTATVPVKGFPTAISLNEKNAVMDYKEGQGLLKLPSVELSTDRINPINNLCGGFIVLTMNDGWEEGDILTLKHDDPEYKFVEVGEKISKIPRISGKAFAILADSQPSPLPSSPSLSKMSAKEKLKNAASAVASPLARRSTIAEIVASDAFKDVQKIRSFEIVFSGMKEPMAVITRFGAKSLVIRFYNEKEKKPELVVGKKQVAALLRNFHYLHASNNPSNTEKTLRLFLSDDGSSTPSQCIFQINLQITDDVTQIKLKSPKKKYIQQPEVAFPLFPHGRSILVDEDTDYFDGGVLHVQCVAGSTKGDSLGLMLPTEQAKVLQRKAVPIDRLTAPEFQDLTVSDDGLKILSNGVPVATVEIGVRDGGNSELKMNFLGKKEDNFSGTVSLPMASYLMNSIVFRNSLEKLKDTSRTYQARIKDAANPQEGKVKFMLDLAMPLFVVSPCPPYGISPTFYDQFTHDVLLTSMAEGALCATLAVNLEKYTQGSCSIQLLLDQEETPPQIQFNLPGAKEDEEGEKRAAEGKTVDPEEDEQGEGIAELRLSMKACGNLVIKDDSLYIKDGKDLVASHPVIDPNRISFSFTSQGKMTKGTLQAILRNVSLLPNIQQIKESFEVRDSFNASSTSQPSTPSNSKRTLQPKSLALRHKRVGEVQWILCDGLNETVLHTILYM